MPWRNTIGSPAPLLIVFNRTPPDRTDPPTAGPTPGRVSVPGR